MLWYKGWLETKYKLAVSLAFIIFFLILFHSMGTKSTPPSAKPAAGIAIFATSFVVIVYTWLAGAGMATQPSFQATKGLHGSTLFTLSLPVTRFRLLAVRALLGWLEMNVVIGVMCCGLWFFFPVPGGIPGIEMGKYSIALTACASGLYFLSVLLATFLDDVWRMWSGMLAFGALWLLQDFTHLPAALNIVGAMSEGSPLLTHAMPWSTMCFSLGISAVLFFASLKIVQSREY